MSSESGPHSTHGQLTRPFAATARSSALWIAGGVLAIYLWVQADVTTFRAAFESRLVRLAEASTHRVDTAFRQRAEELQTRLLSLSPEAELASSITAEVNRLRPTNTFDRLTLIDPAGNIVRSDASAGVQTRPRPRSFEGPLRRAGMLGDPGLEIRHLPVSRARGAPVLIGLGPAELLVGLYWPTGDLYAEVAAAAAEIDDPVALAVLNETGERVHATAEGGETSLRLANTTLSSFPGWRLGALPSERGLEALIVDRKRRSIGLGVLVVGLIAAMFGLRHARRRGHDRVVVTEEPAARHRIGDAILHLERFEYQRHGATGPLSAREVDLLRVLLERRGEVVRREELLAEVWGYAADIETRTLDTFIYRLRRKLEDDPASAQHLLTVRGVGYKLSASEAAR